MAVVKPDLSPAPNRSPGPAVAGADTTRDPSGPLVAEVALAVPAGGDDGVFDYRVPPALAGDVTPGARVLVPLLGRLIEGYCLRLKRGSDVAPEKLKDVGQVLDARPTYPAEVLDLALYTAHRYLCRPGEVLRAALPAPGRYKARAKARLSCDKEAAAAEALRLAKKARVQAAVLLVLMEGPLEPAALRRRVKADVRAALAALEKRGLVAVADARRRKPAADSSPEPAAPPGHGTDLGPMTAAGSRVVPNPAQEAALRAVNGSIAARDGRVFVLHGVTGSGKTEVYLRAAAEALSRGLQVLLLVPEVSLVPQTLERVRSHLGPARVAVAHSYLQGSERLDYWERVTAGEADVVVGARSAVFAPLDRLGLIVLDEEHEDAYKQEEGAPRYHAREVAAWRAWREKATLVLASATPSLETFYRAGAGREAGPAAAAGATRASGAGPRGDPAPYTLLSLPERVGGRPLPPVEVVDMREELAKGNRSPFSRSLERALSRIVGQGRQAILFLNRRGHSTFVLCRDCGWVARCPNCDVSLTYHNPETDLICHYCGYHAPAPLVCPNCGGHRVRYFGAGTERIEDEVRLLVPGARVARLDADVARRTGEPGRTLALFSSGQADILVGTQMVAKGLDLPGVGLVAAVAADTALHLPDFRAAEKTFRLLTQAAGRAGRGDEPGEVIVQTYNPGHPAIEAAARHDYLSFALAEIEARRSLGYPPWSSLVRVVFACPEERPAQDAAAAFAQVLAKAGFHPASEGPADPEKPRFGGPAAAPLARLRGMYRWHVLVFCPDLEAGLSAVKAAVREATGREARGGRLSGGAGPAASVDVDPVSVL